MKVIFTKINWSVIKKYSESCDNCIRKNDVMLKEKIYAGEIEVISNFNHNCIKNIMLQLFELKLFK